MAVISGLLLVIMSVHAVNLLRPLRGRCIMGPASLLILGVTSLFMAYGLYRDKNWSWKLLLILSGFGAEGYMLNVVNGQFTPNIGVIYNSVIIYYPCRSHVRN